MTVYVITCTDPADRGSECWPHGVYRSQDAARNAYRRLCHDSYVTVRLNAVRVHEPRRHSATRRKSVCSNR
jgi:hypothetical protein